MARTVAVVYSILRWLDGVLLSGRRVRHVRVLC